MLPDWDMFQTDHAYSRFHAAARCLSGGPIYTTDVPGRHDVSLLQQMTAHTPPHGRALVLRPDRVGRSSDIYVAHAEARLLRIETTTTSLPITQQGGGPANSASMLGLFNMGASTTREMVRLAEFPIRHLLDRLAGSVDGTTTGTTRHLVRHYTSGAYSGPWSTQDEFSFFEVQVAPRGFEILTAYPVHQVCGTTDVAVLGLLGKMSGAAAIRSLSYHHHHQEEEENAASAQVEIRVGLKALGLLGEYTKPSAYNYHLLSELGRVIHSSANANIYPLQVSTFRMSGLMWTMCRSVSMGHD